MYVVQIELQIHIIANTLFAHNSHKVENIVFKTRLKQYYNSQMRRLFYMQFVYIWLKHTHLLRSYVLLYVMLTYYVLKY